MPQSDKPKTIADLGKDQEVVKPVVGKSMVSDDNKSIAQQIKELQDSRAAEEELLEAGGYDYNGNEAWERAMRNVGRR